MDPSINNNTNSSEEPTSITMTENGSAPNSATAPELPKAKSNKLLITSVVIVLIVLIVAGGFAFAKLFPFNHDQSTNGNDGPNQNQNNSIGAPSDLDLTLLRLQNKAGNIVYSPLSIKYALAMLSDATDGESKNQIANLIGNYTPKTYTNNDNRSFANAMFVRESKKDGILTSYITTLQQKYNASVIFESFTSVAPINQWISDNTMGIIQNMLSDEILQGDEETDFMLINALAIDMDWNNQLQCKYSNSEVPCKYYYAKYAHEKYERYIRYIDEEEGYGFDKITFGNEEVDAAKIGASANRYDIISELGEDYIRSTVLAAYEKWKVEENNGKEDSSFTIDEYMEQLKNNYNKIFISTDFYFSDNEDEIVFAKDLKTYDDLTLQYVGIMPKNEDLGTYINTLTIEKLNNLISDAKDTSIIDNYKDGVVTQVEGYIPFFDFNYDLKLKENLMELGVTDVFDYTIADLSKLTTSIPYPYIQNAFHKASISFTNDGIRAAAAAGLSGGAGAAVEFDYEWDVPIETIDININKPFFFIIRDKSTGENWFAGTVYHPGV